MTDTHPFAPADGVQARWRYLYDMVCQRQPGDDIELGEVTELFDIDEQAARAVMLEAKKHLEEDRQQTVTTKERYGWIVIDAKGNLDEIEKRRRKAYRATTRTARLIHATDRAELAAIDRNRLDFETRNVLAAQSLYGRKSRSFAELERASKDRSKRDK